MPNQNSNPIHDQSKNKMKRNELTAPQPRKLRKQLNTLDFKKNYFELDMSFDQDVKLLKFALNIPPTDEERSKLMKRFHCKTLKFDNNNNKKKRKHSPANTNEEQIPSMNNHNNDELLPSPLPSSLSKEIVEQPRKVMKKNKHAVSVGLTNEHAGPETIHTLHDTSLRIATTTPSISSSFKNNNSSNYCSSIETMMYQSVSLQDYLNTMKSPPQKEDELYSFSPLESHPLQHDSLTQKPCHDMHEARPSFVNDHSSQVHSFNTNHFGALHSSSSLYQYSYVTADGQSTPLASSQTMHQNVPSSEWLISGNLSSCSSSCDGMDVNTMLRQLLLRLLLESTTSKVTSSSNVELQNSTLDCYSNTIDNTIDTNQLNNRSDQEFLNDSIELLHFTDGLRHINSGRGEERDDQFDPAALSDF
ncbi:hypothetical protein C9374_014405 [Naegleria lovaniensis]|uniref:Uncharacterized protein n=1 Tax=Naegleria lovaniensis TaxID=51637 RepID=A0AA88KMJ2_NAELO|nr:uncharacterized protein C9374_014405 [Naegleria lovaniensis]KAG2389005.1 hypothetical protein C9374_014405 [Naegleria lovaniensis]